jgi:hypothetical protein
MNSPMSLLSALLELTGDWGASSPKDRVDKFDADIQADYLGLFGGRSRSRTPGPPPFSAMNSTPAASIAERILSTLLRRASCASSKRFTVLTPTFAARAKSAVLHPSATRAIRHCIGFIWGIYHRKPLTPNGVLIIFIGVIITDLGEFR